MEKHWEDWGYHPGKSTLNRDCGYMGPASADSLTTINISAHHTHGGPVDDWCIKAYVNPNGQLVVSAYWRDAIGDLHETPAMIGGAKNVARFNVPDLTKENKSSKGMRYYKVFYWLDGEFTFDIVECNYGEGADHAIFTTTEYIRSKGLIDKFKVSHAVLYFQEQ